MQFYFVDADKDVGKGFLYTLEEAAALGERIFKTGTWDEFPVSGISTQSLGALANACGITVSMAVEGEQPARTIARMIRRFSSFWHGTWPE